MLRPVDFHQIILGNLIVALTLERTQALRVLAAQFQASVRGCPRRAVRNLTS